MTNIEKILACPGNWGASRGTTYASGIQEWRCGHWEGSAPCECQGAFWTVRGETFASFEDAADFLYAPEEFDAPRKAWCSDQSCGATDCTTCYPWGES